MKYSKENLKYSVLTFPLTEDGDLKSSFCCHDTGTFSELDVLLVQRTDHNSTGLIEFNGQEPPLHMNRESCLSKGLSRMLRGEKAGGHSSLIICSCSPSLTGSVAKDDP